MKRVKQDDTSPKSETPSPVRTPKAERSPSPPAVDVATKLKERENIEKEQEETKEMSTSVIEATASPPPERADIAMETSATVATPVKALTEETGPKFKSPLLQQMLGKGRLKLSKENLAEKSSESSGDTSSSTKSSPDKEGDMPMKDQMQEVDMVTSHVTKTVTRTVTTVGEDGKETVVKTTENTEVSGEVDLTGLNMNEFSKVNGNELVREETLLKEDTVMKPDNSTLLISNSEDSNKLAEGDNNREDLLSDHSGNISAEGLSQTLKTMAAAATGDLLDLHNNQAAEDTSREGLGLPNGGEGESNGISESHSQELNGDIEMRENGQFR